MKIKNLFYVDNENFINKEYKEISFNSKESIYYVFKTDYIIVFEKGDLNKKFNINIDNFSTISELANFLKKDTSLLYEELENFEENILMDVEKTSKGVYSLDYWLFDCYYDFISLYNALIKFNCTIILNDKIYNNYKSFKEIKYKKVLIDIDACEFGWEELKNFEGSLNKNILEEKNIYFFEDKKIKKIMLEYLEYLGNIDDDEINYTFCTMPNIELYKTKNNKLVVLMNYFDKYVFFDFPEMFEDKLKKYKLEIIDNFNDFYEYIKKYSKVAD